MRPIGSSVMSRVEDSSKNLSLNKISFHFIFYFFRLLISREFDLKSLYSLQLIPLL